jgi:hypothetical protein
MSIIVDFLNYDAKKITITDNPMAVFPQNPLKGSLLTHRPLPVQSFIAPNKKPST